MATYSSLKDMANTYEKTVSSRLVLFIKPRDGFDVAVYGKSEYALVPLTGLDVVFAEFTGIGRSHRTKHSRSHKLRMFMENGRFCWGGPEKRGRLNCIFLDKTDGEDTPFLGSIRGLLASSQVPTVSPERVQEALPTLYAKVPARNDLEWDQTAVDAYIRQLWLEDLIRIEAGEADSEGVSEGVVIDLEDLGVDTVITPERSEDGRVHFSGDLSTANGLRKALGDELFNRAAAYIWKSLCRSGLVPLSMIHKDHRKKVRGHIYWDVGPYMKLSKESAAQDKKYNWFVVVTYDDLAALKFENGSEVFDFSRNYDREKQNERLWRRINNRVSFLGLNAESLSEREKDIPGVRIIEFMRSSPVEAAGLQVGDVILKAGDKEVFSPRHLSRELKKYEGDGKATLTYRRSTEEGAVEVDLIIPRKPKSADEEHPVEVGAGA